MLNEQCINNQKMAALLSQLSPNLRTYSKQFNSNNVQK